MIPSALRDVLKNGLPGKPSIDSWQAFDAIFSKEQGLWERPLLLFIDEVDTTPPALLDLLAGRFRERYLHRESHWLHGLALIGVRAVLGIESERGSPFNIQKSLHVPNLTNDEVNDLYRQYQRESGQQIDPAVVDAIYTVTKGQPGLVSWFGELLTDRYNPGSSTLIDVARWQDVYMRACYAEFNNTVMNLINKARTAYRQHVLELFSRSNVRFSLDADWCNYMYLHGIIDQERIQPPGSPPQLVCRFASPFIQLRIYNALTYDLFDEHSPLLAVEPLDDLADVFSGAMLDIPALLRRYRDYLARLKSRGINPWKAQPRRQTDWHLTEAVGHFHLYAWLQEALGQRCVVSPECPTGNGKVDLHLQCGPKRGIIEVKSFVNAYQLSEDRRQAARYARQTGLDRVTLAVFLPVEDPEVLNQLSSEENIDDSLVTVVAIGWA